MQLQKFEDIYRKQTGLKGAPEKQWFYEEFSRPLFKHQYLDKARFKKFLAKISQEIEPNESLTKSEIRVLRVLLLDLFVVHASTKGLGTIGIFTANSSVTSGDSRQYEVILATGKILRSLVSKLVLRGFIQQKPGSAGHSTKIQALQSLVEIFELYELSLENVWCRVAYPIRWNEKIGDKKKRKTSRHKLDGVVAEQAGMYLIYKYARLLRRVDIRVSDVRFLPHEKAAYRIFNDVHATIGGRIYGPLWQRVSKEARPYITINWQETCEIDISSTHPLICYAREGYDLTQIAKEEGKAYELDIVDSSNPNIRSILKFGLLVIFNSETRELAIQGLWNEIIKDRELLACYRKLESQGITKHIIIDELCKKHERIRNHHFEGAWRYLMRIESEIAMRVVDHFTAKNVVVLTVHDSFIVERQYKQELETILYEAITQKLGVKFEKADELMEEKSRKVELSKQELEQMVKESRCKMY